MAYSYNNETDFLKWYKANYGTEFAKGGSYTRPADMDDNVWAAVSHLYRGYQDSLNKDSEIDSINKKYTDSTNSILQRYSSSQNVLDENKRLAQQNASITYDKLKKYLPSQMKAQGLSGLGASESAMLQADSHYMNSMGDIASNYSKDMTDLSNSKNETIADLEKDKNDDLSKIDDKYAGYLRTASDNAFEAYRTGVDTEFENAYKAALTDIESRTDVDAAAMEKYIIDTYSGKVRDSDLELLKTVGATQVAENVKIADEKAAEEKELAYTEVILPALTEFETNGEWDKALAYLEKNKDYFTNQSEYEAKKSHLIGEIEDEKETQSILAGETPVTAPNSKKVYKVVGILSNVDGVFKNKTMKKRLGQAGFTDPYDSNIPNGTTLEYFDSFLRAGMTYYNGKWYLSELLANSENIYSRRYGSTGNTNSNLYNYIK